MGLLWGLKELMLLVPGTQQGSLVLATSIFSLLTLEYGWCYHHLQKRKLKFQEVKWFDHGHGMSNKPTNGFWPGAQVRS
jgi:hypothetical protein